MADAGDRQDADRGAFERTLTVVPGRQQGARLLWSLCFCGGALRLPLVPITSLTMAAQLRTSFTGQGFITSRVSAAPSATAPRQVTCMAKKKGVRMIVTLECTEARAAGATPSRYTTQKVGSSAAAPRRPASPEGDAQPIDGAAGGLGRLHVPHCRPPPVWRGRRRWQGAGNSSGGSTLDEASFVSYAAAHSGCAGACVTPSRGMQHELLQQPPPRSLLAHAPPGPAPRHRCRTRRTPPSAWS